MNSVVAAIITKQQGTGEITYFLVQSQKDYGEFTGHWYPPGGKAEAGESDIEALHRELYEELHIRIITPEFVAETPGDITSKITWWKCDIGDADVRVNSKELAGSGFFTKEEIRSLPLWPATKHFFETYIF
jgi:8-oxo-dGTP pyrophosphatase MutT (NUDIX family)